MMRWGVFYLLLLIVVGVESLQHPQHPQLCGRREALQTLLLVPLVVRPGEAIGAATAPEASVISPKVSTSTPPIPSLSPPVPSSPPPLPGIKPPLRTQSNVTDAILKNEVTVRRVDSALFETVIEPSSLNPVRQFRLPKGWPRSLRPPRWKLKDTDVKDAAIAGAVGGAVTELARTAVLHPVSTVKTRIQAKGPKAASLTNFTFAGLGPALAISLPSAATWFGCRDLVKDGMSNAGMDTKGLAAVVVASAAAGLADSVVRSPVDTIVTRAQAGAQGEWLDLDGDGEVTFSEGAEAVTTAVKDGLSKIPVLALSDVLYAVLRTATLFGLNSIDFFGDVLPKGILKDEATLVFAACVCAAATTPLDVARTRLLLERRVRKGAGILECWGEVLEEEGPGGLFRGLWLRVAYNGILVASLIPLRALGYVAVRDAVLLNRLH